MSHWTTVKLIKIRNLSTLVSALIQADAKRRLGLRRVEFYLEQEPKGMVKGWGGAQEPAHIVAEPEGESMTVGWRREAGTIKFIADDMLHYRHSAEWQNKVLQEYNLQVIKEQHRGQDVRVVEKEGTLYAFVSV